MGVNVKSLFELPESIHQILFVEKLSEAINHPGGAANLLLARVLERELGGKVVSRNTSVTFKGDAAKSAVGVRQAIEKLKAENRPSWRDALRFAPDLTQSRISKFLPCLPDELARELLVD